MLKEKIEKKVLMSFVESDVKIFTTDDKHFNILIISDLFDNKALIERQKMIYDVIGEYILNGVIHAVSLKTYTKKEWLERCE